MPDVLDPIILNLADLAGRCRNLSWKITELNVNEHFSMFIKFLIDATHKLDENTWESRPDLDFNFASSYLRKAAEGALAGPNEDIYVKITDIETQFENQINELKRVGFLKK